MSYSPTHLRHIYRYQYGKNPDWGRKVGAIPWVLLAIGLGAASYLLQEAANPLFWPAAMGQTAAFFTAARRAKTSLGRVILWWIVIGHALAWIGLMVGLITLAV